MCMICNTLHFEARALEKYNFSIPDAGLTLLWNMETLMVKSNSNPIDHVHLRAHTCTKHTLQLLNLYALRVRTFSKKTCKIAHV